MRNSTSNGVLPIKILNIYMYICIYYIIVCLCGDHFFGKNIHLYYKLLKMVKVPHWKFCHQWFNFFCSSKIQMMIIYRRGEHSDTRSGSYQVFQYRSIKPVRIFLHFESGSGILCSVLDILGRVWIFKFWRKNQ